MPWNRPFFRRIGQFKMVTYGRLSGIFLVDLNNCMNSLKEKKKMCNLVQQLQIFTMDYSKQKRKAMTLQRLVKRKSIID